MKKEEKKEIKKIEKTVEIRSNSKKKENYIAEKKLVKKEKRNKENIFKVIGRYFKGVGKEIKRIKWTSGKELVKYSIAAGIALLVRSLAK